MFFDKDGDLNPAAVAKAAALVVLILLFLLAGPFVMLEQTQRGIDYRFGKMLTASVSDLRQPGMSFKLPFFVSVTKVNVAQQQEDFDKVQTYTKDNQVITASLSVYFRVPEDKIVEIYKNNPNWERMLQSAVFDSYKGALGGQEAQFVAQNRDVIMKQVTEETRTKVGNLLGLEVTSVMMPNFDFNDEFEKAVADAANAKAELNKKQTELEQAKVDAQTRVVEAQAAATSAKETADGSSYAIIKNKEAEAQGFRSIAQSIGQENMATYLYTTKWSGNVPQVQAGNGSSSILDLRSLNKAGAAAASQ